MAESVRTVPFRDAFRFWVKLGFINFGGPTGQIAIMHSELVEKRKWITEARFLHALNYCMLLPGPEAQQLAIHVGWLLHRTIGGIVAGVFFVIPSIVILWTLSFVYVTFGNTFWMASIFYGLKAAVIAIVTAAVIRIGRRALKNPFLWLIAAFSFISIFFLKLPFPLIILGAGLIGFIGGRIHPKMFDSRQKQKTDSIIQDGGELAEHTRPSVRRAIRVLVLCLALWWIPVLLLGLWLGRDHTVVREGLFFSKAAMVTFGGAYAVLPYVSQQAVERYHWLQPPQMIDGLGLAETTPGPLIMVVQFIGFLGAWNQPGSLSPPAAASLGALLTTWVTFAPSFLWILLGAPHVEQLRSNRLLTSALTSITAAVVGVVLNLAVWFGIHALFPQKYRFDLFTLLLSAATFLVLVRWKPGITYVVFGSSAIGVLYRWLTAMN